MSSRDLPTTTARVGLSAAEGATTAKGFIPPMTHRLSSAWRQPDRASIHVAGECVTMPPDAFAALPEYSMSVPSGVYEGKMWKRQERDGSWWLCWYENADEPGYLRMGRRKIADAGASSGRGAAAVAVDEGSAACRVKTSSRLRPAAQEQRA